MIIYFSVASRLSTSQVHYVLMHYNTSLADTKSHTTRHFPLRLLEGSGVEDSINHTLCSSVVLNTGVAVL